MNELPKYWLYTDGIHGTKQFELKHLLLFINSINITAVFEDHEEDFPIKNFLLVLDKIKETK